MGRRDSDDNRCYQQQCCPLAAWKVAPPGLQVLLSFRLVFLQHFQVNSGCSGKKTLSSSWILQFEIQCTYSISLSVIAALLLDIIILKKYIYILSQAKNHQSSSISAFYHDQNFILLLSIANTLKPDTIASQWLPYLLPWQLILASIS